MPRGLEHKISSLVQENVGDAQVSILGKGRDASSECIGANARKALILHQQQKQKSFNPWFQHAVGTVQMNSTEHVSVGYTDTK